MKSKIRSILLSLTIVLGFAIGTSFTLTTPQTAKADCVATADTTDPNACPAAGAAGTTAPGADNAAASKDANKTSCAIDKIGWLLCPVMEKVSVISDKAFDVLSDNFLQTDAQLVSSTVDGKENGTKVAWDIARNLANIMFVIAFLVIIISQVTSYGISNYGIKKMIPRLIVAAIAVNVSYYICQLAVDLSNILGYEIEKALGDVANSIGPSVFGTVSNYNGTDVQNSTGDGILTVIAIGALASAALAFVMLPSMLSIIPLILITIVTIIIILLLRKALVVLLVVISPIAFVLYLLPNTERLFSRWMKMFTQLLMVFPIVGMLFGAGQLASTIILVSGASNTGDTAAASCTTGAAATPAANGTATPTNNANQGTGGPATSGYGDKCEGAVQICGGKTSGTATATNTGDCRKANWTLGLVATGVAVAPLLAVWAVLKGALSAAGAIGGKISGAVEKGVSRGVNTTTSKASGFAKDKYKNSAFGVGREIRQAGKQNFKRKRVLDSLGKTGDEASAIDKYRQMAAGGVAGQLAGSKLEVGSIKAQNEAISRTATAQSVKAEHEEVQNAQSAISRETGGNMKGITEALEHAIEEGDEVGAKAAQNLLLGMGGAGADEFIKSMGNKSGKIADALAQNIRQNHGNIKGTSAGLNSWANEGGTVEQAMGRASAYSNLSAEQMAGQSTETLGAMRGAMKSAMDDYNGRSDKTSSEAIASLAAAQGILNTANAASKSKAFEGTKDGNKVIINSLAQGKY